MGVYLAELNGHHGEFWHLGHLGPGCAFVRELAEGSLGVKWPCWF